MSTLISGTVLRVANVLPQPQRTTVSMYWGWMPSFMAETSLTKWVGTPLREAL